MARQSDQRLDGVLHALGQRGWYNFIQLALIWVGTIPCALQLLSNVFIGSFVPHTCAKPDNESMGQLITPFSNNTNVTVVQNMCNIQVLSNETILHTMSCLYGMEYVAPLETSFLSQFGLVCEKLNLAKLTQALVIAGQAFGALVGSAVADRLGRKTGFILGDFVLLGSGLGIAYSTNYTMFAVFKFIVGVGQQMTIVAAAALTSEIMTTKNRRFAFSMAGVGWGISIMLLDVFAYCMKGYSWRTLQMAMSMVSLAAFLEIIFLKESLRWLTANGKKKQAMALIKHNAKLNNKKPDQILQMMENIWQNDIMPLKEKEALTRKGIEIEPDSKTKTLTLFQALKIPRILGQTIIIWYCMCITALAYFTIYFSSTTLNGDKYLNFFLTALMEQPANIFFYFVLNRWGRKAVFIGVYMLVGLGLIGYGVFTSLEASSVNSSVTLVFSLLSMVGVSGSFSFLFSYTLELYPTNIRSQSVGIASVMARVGGMLAPFTSLMSDHVKWGPGVVIGCLALLVVLLSKFMPETKGRELPQTMEELKAWFNSREHREINTKFKQNSTQL